MGKKKRRISWEDKTTWSCEKWEYILVEYTSGHFTLRAFLFSCHPIRSDPFLFFFFCLSLTISLPRFTSSRVIIIFWMIRTGKRKEEGSWLRHRMRRNHIYRVGDIMEMMLMMIHFLPYSWMKMMPGGEEEAKIYLIPSNLSSDARRFQDDSCCLTLHLFFILTHLWIFSFWLFSDSSTSSRNNECSFLIWLESVLSTPSALLSHHESDFFFF